MDAMLSLRPATGPGPVSVIVPVPGLTGLTRLTPAHTNGLQAMPWALTRTGVGWRRYAARKYCASN